MRGTFPAGLDQAAWMDAATSPKEATMNTNTADNLRAAANKIREVGWVQETAQDGSGRVCALGSIALVAGVEIRNGDLVEEWRSEGYQCAERVLEEWLEAQGWICGVIEWNDTGNRKADDVITGMEKAAAWYEEQA